MAWVDPNKQYIHLPSESPQVGFKLGPPNGVVDILNYYTTAPELKLKYAFAWDKSNHKQF